jgi:hypothetical protein
MSDQHPKILFVEGKQDVFVIAELAGANQIPWPSENRPIHIQEVGGYKKLIDAKRMATRLNASGLQAIGLIVDADENPAARWQSLQSACAKSIPDMPTELPPTGLIHTMPSGINLGVWMMPDNQLRGMLETFLADFIDASADAVWQYAQSVVLEAKVRGASFTSTQQDKANIHTWLAWQDEPGQQLHTALQTKTLNGQHPKAQDFVNWLKQLYSL